MDAHQAYEVLGVARVPFCGNGTRRTIPLAHDVCMTKTLQKIVSAQVPADDAELLEQLAREADRSVSAELRRAIRAHLEFTRSQS